MLFDLVKVYVKGVGNFILDIFDLVVCYIIDGVVKLKVKINSSFSVLVGLLFGLFGIGLVMVGNIVVLVVVLVLVVLKKSELMLNDMESYFNKVIKDVVVKGDVDKVLKLFDEVECLGLIFVCFIFISSVKGKG